MIRTAFTMLLLGFALRAQTEKPVALYSGMGTWRHTIATKSPEAQRFFDQGLALTWGFNRPEAVRSFRRAIELDPDAAMAWWGLAQAFGPYINMDDEPSYDMKESCAAVAKGLSVAHLSVADRAWLETAQARCPDFREPAAYVEAAKRLAAAFPDDLDAQVVYAEALMLPHRWRWYSPDGKPVEGSEEAERTLEAVLRRDPNHAGANHLYIHAVESSPQPERGIPSALRLMGIVPGAGHVVHMPGHIWLAVGDYETAAVVNERAGEVDRQYFATTGMMGPYYPYYLHNLSFIVYARGMQGHSAQARKAEQLMAAGTAPMAKMMPEMAGSFEAFITFSKLRTNRWKEVLALPVPPDTAPAVARAVAHYARGASFALTQKAAEAKREQDAFESARGAVDRTSGWGTNKAGNVMDLASAVLAARMETGPAAAVPLWRKAVVLQDALGYDEPPAWYYPVRESLGAALLRAGDAPAAEAVFREALKHSPRNGRVLFGLRESLRAQHRDDAAAMVDREFQAAWKGADIALQISEL